jgi:2,3-dihydroxybenzoate-AMP ligase
MAEGLIMFVRPSDPPGVRRETCGRPASPDDEVYLVDEDGNVVPDGAPGELIVRGPYTLRGYFRSPEENLILAHPAVLNVACVPYPDRVLGERMCACLVLRPGQSLSLEELVAFLRGFEIATFKLPERAAFFDSLPLSGFGKVSKKELAARLADGL